MNSERTRIAKDAAASKKEVQKQTRTCKVLDHVPSSVPVVQKKTKDEISWETKEARDTPVVLKDKLEGTHSTTAIENLKKKFVTHAFNKVGQSGRGSEMVLGENVKKGFPACPVALPCDKVKHFLAPADNAYIASPWVWAMSYWAVAAGAEHLSLASVRYQYEGTRKLLLVEFLSASQFVRSQSLPRACQLH